MRFETTTIRSVLGLRFRDAATEQPVTRGLRVAVRRADGVGGSTQAVRTASGAYVAQGLPGLRGYERAGATIPDRSVSFQATVKDEQDRYVPALLDLALPYDPDPANGGLYPILETPSELEGETREPTCYLFSAVQRPVTVGQSVVYADLVTEAPDGTLQPAPHAVLEVEHEPDIENGNGSSTGATWYSVADAQGRVAVQFPLPSTQFEELLAPPDDSTDDSIDGSSNGNGTNSNNSPTVGGRPLSSRTWTLTVRVRYEPSSLAIPNNADRPVLTSIFGQKPGTIYSDASTPEAERVATLRYGSPLVLTTDGLPNNRAALRIAPHGGT